MYGHVSINTQWKSSHEKLREDGVLILPSSKGLIQKKHMQRFMVGDCLVIYERQLLLHKFIEEIGGLIYDEMKLKEDILINVSITKMVGFFEDFI